MFCGRVARSATVWTKLTRDFWYTSNTCPAQSPSSAGSRPDAPNTRTQQSYSPCHASLRRELVSSWLEATSKLRCASVMPANRANERQATAGRVASAKSGVSVCRARVAMKACRCKTQQGNKHAAPVLHEVCRLPGAADVACVALEPSREDQRKKMGAFLEHSASPHVWLMLLRFNCCFR